MDELTKALNALNILSAMITPAVLISACGTLIFSTSTRLSRVVDRVRDLSRTIEDLSKDEVIDFPDDRLAEVERQLAIHARRSQLIQTTLTSFYIALSLFVAATVAIGFAAVFKHTAWIPNSLGIIGTLFLFYGCVMLIAETRLALRSVNSEMAFTLLLRAKYQERRRAAAASKEEKGL
jgi:threonine/homoserine/homoserine lactone efflux protein